MEATFTVTDGGNLVAEVVITEDGKVIVTSSGTQVKPGEEVDTPGSGTGGGVGNAQYVWGATNVAERARSRPSVRLDVGSSGVGAGSVEPAEAEVEGALVPRSS